MQAFCLLKRPWLRTKPSLRLLISNGVLSIKTDPVLEVVLSTSHAVGYYLSSDKVAYWRFW